MTPLVRGPLVDEVGSVVSVVLVDGGSAARAARVVTARVLILESQTLESSRSFELLELWTVAPERT